MELRTEGVPTRRVLNGDDGTPLDGDRILAVALRWADRPLSVEHVKVGESRAPLEGVEIRWEGNLPVVATAVGTKAWVERSAGQWVDPGRRTALELGETLIVQSGELTLEARLQRRSERTPSTRGHEGMFFGLVMAHTVMICVAFAVALVITPRTDEASMWGAPSLLKRVVSPLISLPERKTPKLEERIDEVVKNATFRPLREVRTPKQATAMDTMRLLFGGGGGGLLAKGVSGIDAALQALGGHRQAADGFSGLSARELGNGFDNGGLSLGRIGGPGGGPGGPSDGPLIGGHGHHVEIVLCKTCLPNLPPGYDRDLVLKV